MWRSVAALYETQPMNTTLTAGHPGRRTASSSRPAGPALEHVPDTRYVDARQWAPRPGGGSGWAPRTARSHAREQGHGRGSWGIDPMPREHSNDRQSEDLEVEPDRLVIDVPQIECEPLVPALGVAP